MAEVYAHTDLAICRAGATTLAELAVCGIPAILIPYPHAANDHQRINAESFVNEGAALCIEEARLSPELLTSIIKTLLGNPGQLQHMASAMRRLGRPDAGELIVKIIQQG